MPRRLCTAVRILLLTVLVLPVAAQMQQTLPMGFDTIDPPGGGTAYPQNSTTDHIWQWHYDSAQFVAQGPIVITDIEIRADLPTATVAAFNFPSWVVTLIEASTDYQVANHNAVFAANILSSSVERTGPFTGGPVPPSGAATATWISMGPLAGNFTYDPTTGNDFIIQIEKCGTTATWAATLDGKSAGVGLNGGNRYGDINTCAATSSSFNNNEFVPVVRITYQPAISDDVEVAGITPTTPSFACDAFGANEPVSITVRNVGQNQIPAGTPMTISYAADANPSVIEVVLTTNALNFGQSETFLFNTPANLAGPGMHSISAAVLYSIDLNPANDLVTQMVDNVGLTAVSSFPYGETLDAFGAVPGQTTPPPAWEQDGSDGMSDWTFTSVPPGGGTGPAGDHTTGTSFFALADDALEQSSLNLLTPCFDLTGTTTPALTFFVHSFDSSGGATPNTLSIDVLTVPGGVPILDVIPMITPSTSNQWEFQVVNLIPFIGQRVQLRFRASLNNGAATNDIAVDDIQLVNFVVGPGQAPQPGLAVFDINDAVDPNGLSVNVGFNGVYTTGVMPGTPLSFSFSGAPNQPIVLLHGPTNASLLGFGPIGQIDVGTGIDPMSGLPTGVQLVADGTQLTLLDFLFRTQSSGSTTIVFPMPNFPLGYVTTFQPIIFTGGASVIAFANAVELHAN